MKRNGEELEIKGYEADNSSSGDSHDDSSEISATKEKFQGFIYLDNLHHMDMPRADAWEYYMVYFDKAEKHHAEIEKIMHREQPWASKKENLDKLIDELKKPTELVGFIKILEGIEKMSLSLEKADLKEMEAALEYVKGESTNLKIKIQNHIDMRTPTKSENSNSVSSETSVESKRQVGPSGTRESSSGSAGSSIPPGKGFGGDEDKNLADV